MNLKQIAEYELYKKLSLKAKTINSEINLLRNAFKIYHIDDTGIIKKDDIAKIFGKINGISNINFYRMIDIKQKRIPHSQNQKTNENKFYNSYNEQNINFRKKNLSYQQEQNNQNELKIEYNEEKKLNSTSSFFNEERMKNSYSPYNNQEIKTNYSLYNSNFSIKNPIEKTYLNYKPLYKPIISLKNNRNINKIKYLFLKDNNSMINHHNIINFKKDLLNFTSYYNRRIFSQNIGRYIHYKENDFLMKKTESILIIQKYIRGWLVRNSLNKLVNYIIRYRLLKHIIIIQKTYKHYFVRKKIREYLIIRKILYIRKKNWLIIEKYIQKFIYKKKVKKYIIITKILKQRLKKIIFLQSAIKTFYMSKLCKQIINYEKYHYVLTYPFIAKTVQLKLFWNNSNVILKNNSYCNLNDKYDIFDFEICPIRKIFILYICTENINPGKYRCQFIINGITSCDGRFPHIKCNRNQFYNILNFDPWKTHLENYNYNEDSYIIENKFVSCSDNSDGFSYSSIKLKNSSIYNNTNKSNSITECNSYSSLNNYEEYFSSNSLFKKNFLKEIVDFGAELELKYDDMLFSKK